MDENFEKSEERILEVTQEEYDQAMAKGWTDDDILKPGKHVFRRARKINPRDAKIKLTFYIEGDILQYFRKRAGESQENFGRILNEELRAAMESDLVEKQKNLNAVAEKLVNNAAFINAISEKLKAT